MTWRSILVTKKCKLSYKNGYLIIRDKKIEMIHLSEINTIIIDSTMVSITSYLLVELVSKKIKLVFCDYERNPLAELVPYYGRFNTSKSIHYQFLWSNQQKSNIWTNIIIEKINNQSKLLLKYNLDGFLKLEEYKNDIKPFDITNREGHAAKVYFNSLFGMKFSRDDDCAVNAALNYGYSILLSNFNKEIVSCGYITQLGLKHCNEYNNFNLSSDLMEPFRVLVDDYVYNSGFTFFSSDYKFALVDLLNKQVTIKGRKHFVTNAISIYVKSVFEAINQCDSSIIEFFDFI